MTGTIVAAHDDGFDVEVKDLGAPPLRVRPGRAGIEGSCAPGKEVMVAIRPEQITLRNSAADGRCNVLPVTLQASQFLGDRYEYTVAVGAESRVLTTPASQPLKPGQKIYLELDPEAITLWPLR